MLPVSDGNVIAATTPIIVRDNNISAIVNAKFLLGFNCGSRSASDIPNLFRDLAGVTGSTQRRIDAETVLDLLHARRVSPKELCSNRLNLLASRFSLRSTVRKSASSA